MNSRRNRAEKEDNLLLPEPHYGYPKEPWQSKGDKEAKMMAELKNVLFTVKNISYFFLDKGAGLLDKGTCRN